MQTSQFEGKKVALKQTKDGHVLTLAIHPDEIPEEILRDFVGARYMVVMVRINDEERPMERQPVDKHISIAGMLCRDPEFWDFLNEQELVFERNEKAVTEWLKSYLNIESRKDLRNNTEAKDALDKILREFKEWKN